MMNRTKLVYISHPYGNKQENLNRILNLIKHLYDIYGTEKYCFISPVPMYYHMYESMDYNSGLKICLDIQEKCDIVLFCKDWKDSKGCNTEWNLATTINQEIYLEDLNNEFTFIGLESGNKL